MQPHVLNLANLALCFSVGWSAGCRLNAIHGGVNLRTALLYLGLFVVSAVSGLQFYLFGTLAGWADVAAALFVAVCLWASVPHWRAGVPSDCLRC